MMYEIHLSNEKLSIMDGHGWNDVIKVNQLMLTYVTPNGFSLCELESRRCLNLWDKVLYIRTWKNDLLAK